MRTSKQAQRVVCSVNKWLHVKVSRIVDVKINTQLISIPLDCENWL